MNIRVQIATVLYLSSTSTPDPGHHTTVVKTPKMCLLTTAATMVSDDLSRETKRFLWKLGSSRRGAVVNESD